jgi:hypothetical protein
MSDRLPEGKFLGRQGRAIEPLEVPVGIGMAATTQHQTFQHKETIGLEVGVSDLALFIQNGVGAVEVSITSDSHMRPS